MNISEPFIQRPVATSLLMAGVVMMGMLGYYYLPISALPAVDFPTIEVNAARKGVGAMGRYPRAAPGFHQARGKRPIVG